MKEVKVESFSQSQHFMPVRNISLWATILLGFMLLMNVLNAGLNIIELFMAAQYPDMVSASLINEDADFTEMPGGTLQLAIGLLAVGIGGFTFLGFIATIVVFLIWMRRSYWNILALGNRRLEYSPAWAVGCWFVPFVNLARPFSIIKEIWRKSDPETLELENAPLAQTVEQSSIVAPMFGLWWGLWIISNVASNFSTRFSLGANTLDEHIGTFWVDIVASVLTAFAALLAITVVRAVTARQEERHKRLTANLQPPFSYSDNMPQTPPTYYPPPPNFA